SFTDAAAIPTGRRGSVAVVARRGLMTGFSDGSFRPDESVTRAQMATLLARADRMAAPAIATGNLVRGSVRTVDVLERELTLAGRDGTLRTLPVAASAVLYDRDGRALLLSELETGVEVDAVTDRLGAVSYLEVRDAPAESPAPAVPPATPIPGSSQGRGYIVSVSTGAAGAITLLGEDARLRTLPLAANLTVTRAGDPGGPGILKPGMTIDYTVSDRSVTRIDVRGSTTIHTGRITRVAETDQYRLLFYDVLTDDGDRESTHVFVASGVPIVRSGQATTLTGLRTGDRVIVRRDGDQARSLTAEPWRREYSGTIAALVFGPEPRLRVDTEAGLVELSFPEDLEDADLRAADPDDPGDTRAIDLFDLGAGDRVQVVAEGDTIVRVTVQAAEATATGTVRSITIADDIRLTLQPAAGGAEQTYPVAPDVEVEAGDAEVSLLDVRAGTAAELYVRGGLVRRIVLEALEALTEFRGRVVYVLGDVAIVEPDDAAGTYRQVALAESGFLLRFNTTSTRIRDLEVGDVVRVVGNPRGDRFMATSIIVLGTR
ncbi:MAG TPA: S-layer homology domain-containing protein, partial [Bacillota bacterium]